MINMPLLLAAIVVLVACTIPRSGPWKNEILAGAMENGGNVHIVTVSDSIARSTRLVNALGFRRSLINAPASTADLIRRGDRISITVWENVGDTGLFSSLGQKATIIQEIQVDQRGNIFMPYAGVLRAADRTPDQLRRVITSRLDVQTPDPQVEVRRLAGDGSSVSVIGGVAIQGVYPIEASTNRLTAMLAKAGGITIEPDVTQVKIRRGSHVSSVWLQDLYDNADLDIALRPGDKIIVEEDRRTFTALGATGTQTRIPFVNRDLNVIEALAQVGGLNSQIADPTGVFVFREEPANVANRVLFRTDIQTPQRFAYIHDLTQPTGVFTARDFQIRDGDTLYVTEAPLVSWQKILNATLGTVNFAGSVAAISNATN
jgi:polysaccharide export outer membrane protein